MDGKDELGKVLRMMDPDELRVLVDKMRPHVGNQRTLDYAKEVVDSESDFDGNLVWQELNSKLNISEEEFYGRLNALASEKDTFDQSELVDEMLRDVIRRTYRSRAKRLLDSGKVRECDELILSIADSLIELDTIHTEINPDAGVELAEWGRECVERGLHLDFFEIK